MSHIDFENIETKFKETVKLKEWEKLANDFKKSNGVYIVANGGLWSVGCHASDDCTRLLPKLVQSLDSTCLLTSIANDYGYNNTFVRWLELFEESDKLDETSMVIGLSCSGNSKNVISALHWAEQHNLKNALISGQKSVVLPDEFNQVCLNTKYFHTTEVLTLILFYELIHHCGGSCPSIKDEIVRKGADVHFRF